MEWTGGGARGVCISMTLRLPTAARALCVCVLVRVPRSVMYSSEKESAERAGTITQVKTLKRRQRGRQGGRASSSASSSCAANAAS